VTRRSGSSIRGESASRRGNKQLKRALFLSAFAAGWAYAAFVIDVFSRRMAGMPKPERSSVEVARPKRSHGQHARC
jgi:transposase